MNEKITSPIPCAQVLCVVLCRTGRHVSQQPGKKDLLISGLWEETGHRRFLNKGIEAYPRWHHFWILERMKFKTMDIGQRHSKSTSSKYIQLPGLIKTLDSRHFCPHPHCPSSAPIKTSDTSPLAPPCFFLASSKHHTADTSAPNPLHFYGFRMQTMLCDHHYSMFVWKQRLMSQRNFFWIITCHK